MTNRFWKLTLSILWVAVFVYGAVMMTGHFRQIAAPNEPLDEEVAILQDMRQKFPALRNVSFTTNLHDDEASQGAYYQTQFVWCPLVLSDDISLHDTIIAYKSSSIKDSTNSLLVNCDTLYQKPGTGYILFLLHKSKHQ